LLDGARSLWHELLGVAHDSLRLAALETKLAGQSLVMMIAAAVMVAVLLVSAWLGLVAAAILALIGSGISASIALLLGVSINLIVALLLCTVIHRKSRYLRWSATIRSLRPLTTSETVALTAQITHLEKRILDRRQSIRRHAASYGHALRNSLTSPVMLLSASGLGFLVGILTRRQSSEVNNSARTSLRVRKLFESILSVIGFSRALLPMLRLAVSWLFPQSGGNRQQE
jgi:signal transduction histidine kinase